MRIRFAVALLFVSPMAAIAQRVSGTVRVDASTVISGAVITALDSAGRTLARTLSDQRGRYSLPLVPATIRLRAVRIGYRPVAADVVRTGGEVIVDLTMDRAPVVLETVRVSADGSCGASPDGRMVLDLWEQARSALLAAIVAREAKPATVHLLEYSRRMDRTRRLISQQQLKTTSGYSTRPVAAARSAARLAAEGYRWRDPVMGDDVYFGPDADVLFDPTFAAAHCFGLMRGSRDHAGQLGLTFRPREIKRDFVDVSGTLWLNPQTPELLQIDYQFTGIDPEMTRAGAGGTARFRTMANGVVFIDSYSILLPAVTEMRQRGFDGNPTSRAVINDLSETGAYVLKATWPDGTSWTESSGTILGRVREEKTGAAVSGAAVSTSGVSSETNAQGEYSLPLPPGRYTVSLLDSAYGAFVRPRRESREVLVARGDSIALDFEVPARQAILGDACRSQPKGGSTIVLLGHVRDGTDLPEKLRVEASWYGSTAGGENVDIRSVNRSVEVAEVNSTGGFLICGIPRRSSQISLRLQLGRATIADTSIAASIMDRPTSSDTRKFEWAFPTGTFAAAAKGDAAAMSGRVTRNGAPVADAEVWVVFADTMVKTDAAGRFRIGGLRAGPQMIQIRRVGLAVTRDTVVLRAREETVRDFAIGALELDTMRTVGKGRAYDAPRLQDFERRRLSGQGGNFISEDDLRAAENVQFSSLIRSHIPGARIDVNGGRSYLLSRTTGNLSEDGPKGCYATVFVDGLIIYDGPPPPRSGGKDEPPDLNQFMAVGLSGVEYYRGGASLPLQYRSRRNDCGTLLLWTRGK